MLASAQFSNHENMQSLNAEKKGGFHSLLRNYPVPTLTLDKSLFNGFQTRFTKTDDNLYK